MTLTPNHTGPNTRRKATYRVGVWCHNCHGPRDFVLDAPHWVCCVCRFVELTWEGELAANPWGDLTTGVGRATMGKEAG